MNAGALLGAARAVVFDLDGTLADTALDLWLALNEALGLHGLPPVDHAVVLGSLHGGLEASARAALATLGAPADRAPMLAARYHACYRARRHAASVAYPGVAPVLHRLQAGGVALAVCTNKTEAEAAALLARLGLHGHFRCVAGADSTPHRKPHPAPLLHALARLEVDVPHAVMVGDSRADSDCAQAAGLPFVLHAAGYGAADVPPHAVAARFAHYAGLLAGLR